jgi:carboxylesterase
MEPTADDTARAPGEARAEVLPGAEPLSVPGGPVGVLVVHGFTGSPQSLRGLAEAFVAAGHTVEMPLLPGHGTSLDEMLTTGWDDWSGAVDAVYQDLAGRCDQVAVAGLSMGGTLTLWLAARHPEIAGVVLVNPACPAPGSSAEMIAGLQAMADGGIDGFEAIGSDIADPDQRELAYEQTPVRPLIDLLTNAEDVAGALDQVRCPVLLMTSAQDHVVDPANSEHIASVLGDRVERVALERSYHVATLDFDRELIEQRAVDFVAQVTKD